MAIVSPLAEMDSTMRDRRFSRVMRLLNALVLALILLGYLAVPTQNAKQLLATITMLSIPLFLAMHGLRREASGLSRNGGVWANLAAGLLAALAIGIRVHKYDGIHWPQWWQLPGLIFMGSLAFLSAIALIFKNSDAEAGLYRSFEPASQGHRAHAGQRIEPVFTNSATAAATPLPIPNDEVPAIVQPRTTRRANYFMRHWRGELSLPVSYWLNNIGISFLVLFGAMIAKDAYGDTPLRWVALITLTFLCSSLLIWLWSSVGVWRSASRRSRTGSGRGWAIAAQITVLLGVLGHLNNLKLIMLPEIRELGLMALGLDPIGKAVVRLSSDGRTVYFSGGLRTGAADQVEQILQAAPQAHLLVLDSYGGRIAEAKILAHVVKAHGMDTHVERFCASACTYVLLAGKHRTAAPNARIGFHQPSFAGLGPAILRGETKKMLDYYRAAGLPESFVQRIGITPASSLWFPTQRELQAANVVTQGHGTTQ